MELNVKSVIPEYDQLNWVIIHGRGVLNTGHAGAFARILATAGVVSGRESYYYMRYDDSPERDNIPMIFYTVIGNPKIDVTLHEEVEPVGEVFSAIVVMEPTILISQTSQRALLFDGAKKDAVLVVNTSLSSNDVVRLVKKRCLAQDWCGKLVTIRAKKYDVNIAFPLLAALAKAWRIVSLDDLLEAFDSVGHADKTGLVKRVYSDVEPVEVRIAAKETLMAQTRKSKSSCKFEKGMWDLETYRSYQKAAADALSYAERLKAMPSWQTLSPGLIEFGPSKNKKNVGFTTSFARFLRPTIDKSKCTDCKMCSLYCPDGAIDSKRIVIDLNYCKGCGICTRTCPSKAISMMSELLAEEGLNEKEITAIEDALVEYGY
jgi:2-oxoacid:acceptor oxidoreductase delta subunit (pyruvate/2-ketoisovalerate family)